MSTAPEKQIATAREMQREIGLAQVIGRNHATAHVTREMSPLHGAGLESHVNSSFATHMRTAATMESHLETNQTAHVIATMIWCLPKEVGWVKAASWSCVLIRRTATLMAQQMAPGQTATARAKLVGGASHASWRSASLRTAATAAMPQETAPIVNVPANRNTLAPSVNSQSVPMPKIALDMERLPGFVQNAFACVTMDGRATSVRMSCAQTWTTAVDTWDLKASMVTPQDTGQIANVHALTHIEGMLVSTPSVPVKIARAMENLLRITGQDQTRMILHVHALATKSGWATFAS